MREIGMITLSIFFTETQNEETEENMCWVIVIQYRVELFVDRYRLDTLKQVVCK